MWIWAIFLLFSVSVDTGTCYNVLDIALLKTGLFNGYDALTLPDANINVTVDLHLSHILSMDLDEQAMSFSGYLTVTWIDRRLSWDNFPNIETIYEKEGKVWRPDLVIANQVDKPAVLVDENMPYKLSATGFVIMELPVSTKVHCDMDITYYPFDRHRCGVMISSWTYDHSETSLKSEMKKVLLNDYQENGEWTLDTATEVKLTVTSGSLNRTYSQITFYVTLTRHSWMFGLSFILPLVVLTALSVVTFVLPVESGEKASYSVIILLALVVLYTVTFVYFPISAGVTVLVIYAALELIMLSMEVVCAFLVLYFYHHYGRMLPRTVAILRVLRQINCSSNLTEDNKANAVSEITASKMISQQDLSTVSRLPNGDTFGKRPHGRLSPIHRKVVPTKSPDDSLHYDSPVEEELETHRLPNATPPAATFARNSKAGLQPHKHSGEVTHLQWDDKTTGNEEVQNLNQWREMSKYLDRLFFIVFLLLQFLLHFVCLIVLGVGGD